MSYVAVFDIGTTVIKGLLADENAQLFGEQTVEITTFSPQTGIVEQQSEDWWQAIRNIASNWWKSGIEPDVISAITFSGQMEDTIPISKTNRQYNAILYADTRAGEEADWIKKQYPNLYNITGNSMSATTPLAKMKWIQNNHHDQFADTLHFIYSAKDYVIYQLTNKAVTDTVTAATTGMMNLRKRAWHEPILHDCELDKDRLPDLLEIDEIVGNVSREASKLTGFATSTLVINGSGDAGASTLGAGAVKEKDGYFYLGTTGWLAVIENNEESDSLSEGHFNLAFVGGRRISVAPLLNVGNVHNWAVNTFIDGQKANKYAQFEALIEQAEPGSDGVFFLPYLNGERNPIIDAEAKGAYWGIHDNTGRKHLARAALEGVTFSLKQTLDLFEWKEGRTFTLIGGGAESEAWCQMLADVMNHPIRVPLHKAYLPSIGIAATAFSALGWIESYEKYIDTFIKTMPSQIYTPIEEHVNKYDTLYQTFKKLHPALQGMYK